MSGPSPRRARRLDPGYGLNESPPRKITLRMLHGFATCSTVGAWAFALTLAGTVFLLVLVGTQLLGVEAKGAERYGVRPFYLGAGSVAVTGLACYALFAFRRRRHLRFVRDGVASRGQVWSVEVLARNAWWRRGGRMPIEVHRGPQMGRFRITYRYRFEDEVFEGEDVVDTRFGNGQLCRLPEPRPGDRLTVLVSPTQPDDSVLALGIGAGLQDP